MNRIRCVSGLRSVHPDPGFITTFVMMTRLWIYILLLVLTFPGAKVYRVSSAVDATASRNILGCSIHRGADTKRVSAPYAELRKPYVKVRYKGSEVGFDSFSYTYVFHAIQSFPPVNNVRDYRIFPVRSHFVFGLRGPPVTA